MKNILISMILIMGLGQTVLASTTAKAIKKTNKTAIKDNIIKVKMTTSKGDIIIGLNQSKAPVSVKNFLSYVDKKYYDGTIYHRVIKGFMIQGGGFTSDMKKKNTGKAIKNEAKNGLTNEEGTIAMARTGVVDSATSQFFINVANNASLNHQGDSNFGYAVFGRVIKGMPVVNKIKATTTGTKMGFRDVPLETVIIKSIKRI
jgi:peptidyl-prolyl cis-trans isomerase A (cyclophilin A)